MAVERVGGRERTLPSTVSVPVVRVGGPVAGADRRVGNVRAPGDVIGTPTYRMSDVIEVAALAFSTLHLGTRIYQSAQTFVAVSK